MISKELTLNQIASTDFVESVEKNPINHLEGVYFTESEISYIDITMFNKVFYLVFKGKLHQFKIIKTIRFPMSVKWEYDNEYVDALTLINIAGVGLRWIISNEWGYGLPFEFYKNVECFKKGLYYNIDCVNGSAKVSDIFGDLFAAKMLKSIISNRLYPVVWKWDGLRAVCSAVVDVPLFFVVDAEGIHLPAAAKKDYGYRSKEECEKNNSLKVVCFAD